MSELLHVRCQFEEITGKGALDAFEIKLCNHAVSTGAVLLGDGRDVVLPDRQLTHGHLNLRQDEVVDFCRVVPWTTSTVVESSPTPKLSCTLQALLTPSLDSQKLP